MDTVATAFTDHLDVILRLTLDTQRGKGYWRMNMSLLNEPAFQTTIQDGQVAEAHKILSELSLMVVSIYKEDDPTNITM
jgi:hypothetical protein